MVYEVEQNFEKIERISENFSSCVTYSDLANLRTKLGLSRLSLVSEFSVTIIVFFLECSEITLYIDIPE